MIRLRRPKLLHITRPSETSDRYLGHNTCNQPLTRRPAICKGHRNLRQDLALICSRNLCIVQDELLIFIWQNYNVTDRILKGLRQHKPKIIMYRQNTNAMSHDFYYILYLLYGYLPILSLLVDKLSRGSTR